MNVLEQFLNKEKYINKLNPFYNDVEEVSHYFSKLLQLKQNQKELEQLIKKQDKELFERRLFDNQYNWSTVINKVLELNNYTKQGIMFISPKGSRIRCNKFIKSDLFHDTLKNNTKTLKSLNKQQLEYYEKYKTVQEFSKKDSKFFYKPLNKKHFSLSIIDFELKDNRNKLFDLEKDIRKLNKEIQLILKIKTAQFVDNIRVQHDSKILDNIISQQKLSLTEYFKNYNFVKDSLDGLLFFLKELPKVQVDYELQHKSIGQNNCKIKANVIKNKELINISEKELFLLILCVGMVKFKHFYNYNSKLYSNGLQIEKSKFLFEKILNYYLYS